MNQSRSQVIFRLTALWALCESGLGGWMHALHLPFTGFFVGAFAIVLVSLIAFYSRNNFSTVVRATLLVILVKAAVSPQSPPPAYLAVAFQGFVGAALFRILSFPIACVLLGVLAMVESALQKVIIATLVFGKSLWQAIDALFVGIVKEFSRPANLSFSMWLIVLYTAIYAVWGLVLGIWMMRLAESERCKSGNRPAAKSRWRRYSQALRWKTCSHHGGAGSYCSRAALGRPWNGQGYIRGAEDLCHHSVVAGCSQSFVPLADAALGTQAARRAAVYLADPLPSRGEIICASGLSVCIRQRLCVVPVQMVRDRFAGTYNSSGP
jgi:hypothetical protein